MIDLTGKEPISGYWFQCARLEVPYHRLMNEGTYVWTLRQLLLAGI